MLGFERLDMTIFERIKELADKQGKSLQKVSEDLGLSQNYIYNLKGAKSPAADKLALIADYFNVSVDYLMGRSNFINKKELIKYASNNSRENRDIFDGLNTLDHIILSKELNIQIVQDILKNIENTPDGSAYFLAWLDAIIKSFALIQSVSDNDGAFDNYTNIMVSLVGLITATSEKNNKDYHEQLGKLIDNSIELHQNMKNKDK